MAVSVRPSEDRMGFEALTSTAGRVLGSEVVVIVSEADGRPPQVVGAFGLEGREVAELEAGLAGASAGFLEREFEGVLSAGVTLDGEPLGAIHALKRARGPFDNEDLIHAFASQVALAIGVRDRPPVLDERLETWEVLDQLVLSAHSLEELSRALTEVIGPLFGGARTGVMIADRQRNVLQMMPGAFGAEDEAAASHRVSFFDARSNSARVLMTGRPYISNISAGDSGIRQEYVDVFNIERVLTLPLRQVGILHIANGDHDFDLDDLERAQALAPRIASILELATTLFSLRRQQRLEETLSSVAVAVASGESVEVFLPPALEELCAATEASLVAFVSEDAQPIVARAGPSRRDIEDAVLEEAGSDPGMRAYVIGPQKAGDPGWAAFYVPVHLGSVRVGTLAALRVRGEPFARAERRSFARMANLAALTHATERYQQQRAELARLQERQRIADDLHDDVAQILFAAQLSLDSILEQDDVEEDVAAGIARARGLLIRGDTAIRTVIHRLSSPRAADIGTRLASVVSGVEDEFSIAIRLQVDEAAAAMARNLRRPASDALVKVARESLVNAAKHAGPCRVGVKLEVSRRDRLQLTVSDDGQGIPKAAGRHSHGLESLRRLMRDQGGSLRFCQALTGGAKITASIALDGRRPDATPAGGGDAERLANATVSYG
jgi:signal transduction histidine kinase